MNEKDWLAAIARRRPLVDKSQADPMVQHFEHALPLISRHFSRIVRRYLLAPNQKLCRTWWRIWRSCVIMLASSFELSPDSNEPL
jgi:hypothetical protein